MAVENISGLSCVRRSQSERFFQRQFGLGGRAFELVASNEREPVAVEHIPDVHEVEAIDQTFVKELPFQKLSQPVAVRSLRDVEAKRLGEVPREGNLVAVGLFLKLPVNQLNTAMGLNGS